MVRLTEVLAPTLVLVLGTGSAALAQTARSGGSASAQLMQQMQQLASERTTLQAENEKLKKQLADLTKDRDALKAGQQSLDRRAKEASTALAHSASHEQATEQELTQTKAKIQELIARFRETIQKLRDSETEDATEKQSLAARERELAVCVQRNVALYDLNDELLTHLEKQGFWSRVARSEPFTQIARNRNENLVDGYRARAHEQRIAPGSSVGSGRPNAAPNPSPPSASPPDATVH